jgi:hypothetical protein
MRLARIVLVAFGVAFCAVGAVFLLQDVAVTRWSGILVWMAAAIVLHDGILAPILVAIGLGAGARASRLGRRTVRVLQGLLVIGATATIAATPGLIAVARGSVNDTISVGPYALALGVVWTVLGVIAAVTFVVGRHRAAALSR